MVAETVQLARVVPLAQLARYQELIELMPEASTLALSNVCWETYEALLETMIERRGLRLSYTEGTLQVMTLSAEHENHTELIKLLVRQLSLAHRIKVLFFGSTTMKKEGLPQGAEPDACFYVQSADLLSHKNAIDFNTDPPPDVVVETDIHHDSQSKFSIYASFGVPEFWRYYKGALTIYHLQAGEYVEAEASLALPLLTSAVLTDFINRSRHADQYEILLAFEDWLQAQP